MKIEGKSPAEIAEALDRQERTITIWFSDPLIKDALQAQIERINEIFAERMATNGLIGLEVLKEMALEAHRGDIGPTTRLEIVRELLNRSPVGSNANQSPYGQQQGSVNIFANMTDSQLLDAARQLAGNVVQGSGQQALPPSGSNGSNADPE